MSTSTISPTDPRAAWTTLQIQTFLNHKQTRAVVKALRRARAYAAETRAKVDAYTAPIFAKYEFYNDLEASRRNVPRVRLTSDKNLYLSQDAEGCARYFAEVSAAHAPNGFPDMGDKCPALVAEHAVVKLENALLTWASTFFNFDFTCRAPDLRARALALFECK